MVVQVLLSLDVCSWKALPYAASHVRVTELIAAVAPRSTVSHCASDQPLDQRVPVSPSTAAEAPKVVAFSVEEANAGRPWDSRTGVLAPEDQMLLDQEPPQRLVAKVPKALAWAKFC